MDGGDWRELSLSIILFKDYCLLQKHNLQFSENKFSHINKSHSLCIREKMHIPEILIVKKKMATKYMKAGKIWNADKVLSYGLIKNLKI